MGGGLVAVLAGLAGRSAAAEPLRAVARIVRASWQATRGVVLPGRTGHPAQHPPRRPVRRASRHACSSGADGWAHSAVRTAGIRAAPAPSSGMHIAHIVKVSVPRSRYSNGDARSRRSRCASGSSCAAAAWQRLAARPSLPLNRCAPPRVSRAGRGRPPSPWFCTAAASRPARHPPRRPARRAAGRQELRRQRLRAYSAAACAPPRWPQPTPRPSAAARFCGAADC